MTTPQTVPVVQVFDYLYAGPTAVPNETISVQLTYGQATYSSPVVALTTSPYTATTDANGYWTVSVPANDLINPSGTTYSVRSPLGTYDISVPSVAVPAGGWQSSAIVVNTPPSIGVTGPNLPGGTTVLGAFTVSGDTILNADTVITADDGIALDVLGVVASSSATLRVRPVPSNAGGTQGFQVLGPVDPGAITADYRNSLLSSGTVTYHASSFGGTMATAFWNLIQPPTYKADAALNINKPATLVISAAPIASTNVTFPGGLGGGTAPTALLIQSGGANIAGDGSANYDNTALAVSSGFIVFNPTRNNGNNSMGINIGYVGSDALVESVGFGVKPNPSNNLTPIGANIATQRYITFAPEQFTTTTGAHTITSAATVAITAAPTTDGSGVVMTNAYALWVQGGKASFGTQSGASGPVEIHSSSSSALTVDAGSAAGFGLQVDESTASAATGLKIKPAASGAGLALSVISPAAAEALKIDALGTGTITIAGTSTGNLTLGSTSNLVGFGQATTALGGGAAPTVGTIGGSGPATAAQNSWLKVNINGTASYIPVWR